MMTQTFVCPNCDSGQISLFYKMSKVPVHSVVLMRSREQALAVQQGDINLGFCSGCGFVGNFDFQENLIDYAAEYESTQAYSPQFNVFHQQLAEQLINRYGLHNKEIIEIGCGHGEFLELVCRLGHNKGLGFDPAYQRDLFEDREGVGVKFIRDYYSERYSHLHADFVISKMTLEHIFEAQKFTKQLHHALGSNSEAVVYIQVPDATRILEEAAFWDIHYEHCCYFTPTALSTVFQASGFDILDVRSVYFDTYLVVEAKKRSTEDRRPWAGSANVAGVKGLVEQFSKNIDAKIKSWGARIKDMYDDDQRMVIWGSSSKATAFLSTLGIKDEIRFVVDINPHRQGTFMPGTGQEIVAPEFLRKYKPHEILVINPIYCEEVQRMLDELGVSGRITTPQETPGASHMDSTSVRLVGEFEGL